jgi:hypothetical protein
LAFGLSSAGGFPQQENPAGYWRLKSYLRQTPAGLVLSHTSVGPGEVCLHGRQNVAGWCQEFLPSWAKNLAHEAAD